MLFRKAVKIHKVSIVNYRDKNNVEKNAYSVLFKDNNGDFIRGFFNVDEYDNFEDFNEAEITVKLKEFKNNDGDYIKTFSIVNVEMFSI